MPRKIYQGDQEYVPTGIHWQVAQATSLQNIHFEMSVSDSSGAATAVGIFMENGSGGFVRLVEIHRPFVMQVIKSNLVILRSGVEI